jgi:hypothetical protein
MPPPFRIAVIIHNLDRERRQKWQGAPEATLPLPNENPTN